jgi:hypothetical protein
MTVYKVVPRIWRHECGTSQLLGTGEGDRNDTEKPECKMALIWNGCIVPVCTFLFLTLQELVIPEGYLTSLESMVVTGRGWKIQDTSKQARTIS